MDDDSMAQGYLGALAVNRPADEITAITFRITFVYVLREIERLDNTSIAEWLELSESNVKVRFHRSKELLKEIFCELSNDVELFEFGGGRWDKRPFLFVCYKKANIQEGRFHSSEEFWEEINSRRNKRNK